MTDLGNINEESALVDKFVVPIMHSRLHRIIQK